eukprot:10138359-Alexandrium_andersonii.AAC.1
MRGVGCPSALDCLLKQKISLCCGSASSHRAHLEAFIKIREYARQGYGPTLADSPDPSSITAEVVALRQVSGARGARTPPALLAGGAAT